MHAHTHPPGRLPALLTALALGAASAAVAAQGLTAGGTGAGGSVSGGAARGGPALAAPAPGTAPANAATPTPSAAAPLPGQSTLPSQLPPLNANGLAGAPAAGAGPNAVPAAGAIPSRSATAAQAFGLLDRGQVGYVTRADTDRIPGFVGFDNADSNRDGQLSAAEFNAAWRFYSGQ